MRFLYSWFALFLAACTTSVKPPRSQAPTSWCSQPLRPALEKLTPVPMDRTWFKIYSVGVGVYAIAEPYNFQEVICYLITGKSRALLFDTGMGMDSISPVAKQLTSLPIIVLNSHTHYDHIGGNYEFSHILALNSDFTRRNALHGYSHAEVAQEVTPAAFCAGHLPGLDTATYYIHPFKISGFIADGDTIDLGGRILTVIATPGHAPDAICLWDKSQGYLFTGDSYYNGPIYLFSKGADVLAYQSSIHKLSALVPRLKRLFPAHNLPVADPNELTAASALMDQMVYRRIKGEPAGKTLLEYKARQFSFLVDSNLLPRNAPVIDE